MKTTTTAAAAAQTETAPTVNGLGVSNAEFLKKFESVSDDDLKEVELQNLNFEQGEVHNLIALDVREMDFQDGKKEVVILEDITGAQKYNGNSYVVNTVKRLPRLPLPVRIVCTGQQKGLNGTYKTFSIKTIG